MVRGDREPKREMKSEALRKGTREHFPGKASDRHTGRSLVRHCGADRKPAGPRGPVITSHIKCARRKPAFPICVKYDIFVTTFYPTD